MTRIESEYWGLRVVCAGAFGGDVGGAGQMYKCMCSCVYHSNYAWPVGAVV